MNITQGEDSEICIFNLMDNNEYFKKLNKKAQEEPDTGKKPTPRPKERRLFQPYGFATYTGMNPKVYWGIFFYCILWFTFVLIFFGGEIKVDPTLWLQLGAGLGGLLVLSILIGYLRFRGWMERLPFPLLGWTELIHVHKMNKQRYYRLVTLEVVLKPGISTDLTTSVTNVIKILNNKQNRWIKPDTFNDGRQPWKLVNYLSANGTVNNVGMGRIKKRLEAEFTEIQKRTGCIDKILIRYDKKEITWEPPNTDTMS